MGGGGALCALERVSWMKAQPCLKGSPWRDRDQETLPDTRGLTIDTGAACRQELSTMIPLATEAVLTLAGAPVVWSQPSRSLLFLPTADLMEALYPSKAGKIGKKTEPFYRDLWLPAERCPPPWGGVGWGLGLIFGEKCRLTI